MRRIATLSAVALACVSVAIPAAGAIGRQSNKWQPYVDVNHNGRYDAGTDRVIALEGKVTVTDGDVIMPSGRTLPDNLDLNVTGNVYLGGLINSAAVGHVPEDGGNGGVAVMVLTTDAPVPEQVLGEILADDGFFAARFVALR